MASSLTFSNDDNLPALPLSNLEDTLNRYLESARPHLTEEDFLNTKRIVEEFEKGVGRQLDGQLQQRASSMKNWLEEWWLQYAYLSDRSSLMMGTNFAGLWISVNDNKLRHLVDGSTAPEHGSIRSRTMASFISHLLRYWLLLRQEKIEPHTDAQGHKFSMNQFRYLFNTARSPDEGMDKINCSFKTEKEGSCPNHIIVLHNGHFYKCQPFYPNGQPWSAQHLDQYFTKVENNSEEHGSGVGALTSTDRDTWQKNYKKLCTLSERNAKNLQLIESAIMICILDEGAPDNDNSFLQSMLGGATNLCDFWGDKTMSFIATKNGLFASQTEHTPCDGYVTSFPCAFTLEALFKRVQNPSQPIPDEDLVELIFDMDQEMNCAVKAAMAQLKMRVDQLRTEYMVFNHFGKNHIKSWHIHPDTVAQVTLQVAAYLTHQRPLATYETATTRAFHHGRTETVRSCTSEALDLAKAVEASSKFSKQELLEKLKKACAKHDSLMAMGKQNHGCDRHLLGLQILARANGLSEPEIFKDPAFIKSGGKGNFYLSTSLTGFTTLTGGCAPMLKDGYGFFYGIPDNQILAWVTSYRDSSFTQPDQLWNNFTSTLLKFDSLFSA